MENTNIEWCDHTFNPVEGCEKVSAGCKNCYAEANNARWHGGTAPNWGPGAPRRRTSTENWRKPRRWEMESKHRLFRECFQCQARSSWAGGECPQCGHQEGNPVRPKVFCASLADWLDPAWENQWRADLLKLIYETPNLDWLLLSKRPEHFHQLMQYAAETVHDGDDPTGFVNWVYDWFQGESCPPDNVWIGTSAEDQENWDQRIPHLNQIPAKVHFVSAEPLLGPIDIGAGDLALPDWLIAGGESGRGARPIEADWVSSLRDQCVEKNVAFFFKQWGGVNKKTTGRELDDRTWEEMPV